MKRHFKKSLALLLVGALLAATLSSCASSSKSSDDPASSASPGVTAGASNASDHVFTVRYNAGQTLNPITGTSPDNMALAPLMYEGLFVLNDKMEAESVLCDSFSTSSDGKTYTIKLKSGVAMSDGSTLNAADVKYSLNWASQLGRFAGRFGALSGISTVDALTLKITLTKANYKLPELLDVPIIKSGAINSTHPAGSGPYYYDDTGSAHLVALTTYRDAAKIPVSEIYLKDCTNSDLSVEFSSQTVDMFWDDPADASEINILNDHEIRYYNTTILQYVGFNLHNRVLSNAKIRNAFSLIIDRKSIVSAVYNGHALAAPLILSPNYKFYDTAWEPQITDTLSELSSIFSSLGMRDDDTDGFLEFPSSGNTLVPFKLTFIVNGDNSYKVAAAQQVVDSLKKVGINVELKPLSWSAYVEALKNGNFDMYYGDVYLPADNDLSALLAPGGSVDYGHAGTTACQTRINALLAASDEETEKTAAAQLCAYVDSTDPIIPILYRQYTVHANRNVISGLNPTQSDIFYGLTSWKINLS
ncbi:ABC transporter substrate-binding protein [Oscillospiraceae bacterium CM]|nr:ABC transporter substrate-binding protein [Oscillospiraceae bacterium CM]